LANLPWHKWQGCLVRFQVPLVVFFPPILKPQGFSPVIAVHCALFSVKLYLKTVQITILIFLPVLIAVSSAIITFVRAGHFREWRRDRYRTGQHSSDALTDVMMA